MNLICEYFETLNRLKQNEQGPRILCTGFTTKPEYPQIYT